MRSSLESLTRVAVLVAGFVIFAGRASAVSFDLIVVDELQVEAPGGTLLAGVGSLGILVATAAPITLEDLDAASITSTPGATLSLYINDPELPTIGPGQYAGETSQLSEPALTSLLTPGENPAPKGFAQGFSFVIEYNPYLTAGESLSSTFSLLLGSQVVTFDVLTTVVDGGEGHSFTAQRLQSSMVPEPSTLALVAIGLCAFARARDLRKKRPTNKRLQLTG